MRGSDEPWIYLFHHVSKPCAILTIPLQAASKLQRFLGLKHNRRTGSHQFSPENNQFKEAEILIQAFPAALWPCSNFCTLCCSKGHLVIFLPKTNSLKIQGKGARYDLIEKRNMESYLGKGEEGDLEPSPAFLLVYCCVWEFLLQQYVTGIIRQQVGCLTAVARSVGI